MCKEIKVIKQVDCLQYISCLLTLKITIPSTTKYIGEF